MGERAGLHRSWSRTFPAKPTSVAEARRFLREVLLSVDGRVDAEAVLLMVSELASNAMRHGNTRVVDVTVQLNPGDLVVSVGDASPAAPVVRWPGDDDAGGRGLALVDRLAAQWGVEQRTGGKWVWFRSQVG